MIKIVEAIFEEKKLIFFLCELVVILRVGRKLEKAGDICKRTQDIECEQDWSVGLDATLADELKIKKYFSSFRDFSGKSR